jgi:hypothetical protein
MPRRLPSSALDTQTVITAVAGTLSNPQATLSGYWKLDQKLTGDITGNAGTAAKWTNKVVVNGTDLDGATTPVTIGVNTTSNPASGTYRPLFVPSNAAGNQQASTSDNLSYNPSTGYLSATRFVGSGAGLTDLIIPSYAVSAIGSESKISVRLYSSITTGATYSYNTNTASSVLRIGTGLGALDAGETALRAVFNATNPATGQPYGDLNGNGLVDDAITILQLEVGLTSPTSRSNQLLAAIAASADIGLIVRYGWINSSVASDVILRGGSGVTTTRTGNTITFAIGQTVATDSDVQFGSIGVGTTAPGGNNVVVQGNVTAYSDRRLKDNIETITNALNKVNQVRGVTYTRTDIEDAVTRHTGVVAQELESVLPEAVMTGSDGIKSVAYGNVIGLLIESIKELDAKVNKLQQQLDARNNG